jgi:pimeloyl-ACP methyl ester carboxylesterase
MDKVKLKNGQSIEGDLVIPAKAVGIVIFSHGCGSSRFSPRNNFVAQHLQKNRFATFLVNLLTEEEDSVSSNRFNIELLTQRLVESTRYVIDRTKTLRLPVGFFGSSTGAASAIAAAAILRNKISAVVCRGGRPDLVTSHLYRVKAATLFIVGSLDHSIVTLNREAFAKVQATKSLKVIPGASHLFEEPGTLEQVADLATGWFSQHLARTG